MSNYQVGDIITYAAFGGLVRRVKVTAKYADIKNGRAGFDADLIRVCPSGAEIAFESVWGYDSQIVIDAPRERSIGNVSS